MYLTVNDYVNSFLFHTTLKTVLMWVWNKTLSNTASVYSTSQIKHVNKRGNHLGAKTLSHQKCGKEIHIVWHIPWTWTQITTFSIKKNSQLRSPPWKRTSKCTKSPFVNPFVKEETTKKASNLSLLKYLCNWFFPLVFMDYKTWLQG